MMRDGASLFARRFNGLLVTNNVDWRITSGQLIVLVDRAITRWWEPSDVDGSVEEAFEHETSKDRI